MEGLDLHLGVDKAAGFVGRALETALREAIRSGRLHPGARLPGSRSLAADLGISRGTVVQAYTQLIAEGWLTGTTGSGTRVADLPGAGSVAGLGEDLTPAAARLAVDLRPGRPDLSSFPRTDWATSVRRALSAAPYEDLDYAEPAGLPVLRAAVADYVTRARGVRADAAAVVITAGFTPGLALLARVLRRLGARTVATEDPGLGRHRDVLHAAGLATVPLEVGPGGADPGGLAPGSLAPGSLAPGSLAPARWRARAVRASGCSPRRTSTRGGWCWRLRTVRPSWTGPGGRTASSSRTTTTGSSATTSSRWGRCRRWRRTGWYSRAARARRWRRGCGSAGWSCPRRCAFRCCEAMAELGAAVPAVQQLAMADLIGRGGYDRHIRRMRLVYRRRRAELAGRLAMPLEGVAAGLHALLPVASAEQERVLIARGRRSGVGLHGLHAHGYWRDPGGDQPAALILGYAVRANSEMRVTGTRHLVDAALAAGVRRVVALSWPAGFVNVCDDVPAAGREWMPAFCRAVGVVAEPAASGGERHGWARGASNEFARKELNWTPAWPSWREGFAAL